MRAAARSLTQSAPRPTWRKRGKGEADGKSIARNVARELAEDYLKLCQNPARNVLRWLAEDRKRPGRIQIVTRAGRNDAASRRETFKQAAQWLRRHPLPAMRHGLDAHRQGGRGADNLPPGQGEGAGQHGRLRPLRAAVEGLTHRARHGDDLAGRFGAMAEGISAEFRHKLAALRHRLRPWEMAAAIRALQDERHAAMRALRERRAAYRHSLHEPRGRNRGSPQEFKF